jgi:hypothetical protein
LLYLLDKIWTKIKPWITPIALAPKARVPNDVFRIVENHQNSWWQMRSKGNEPLTRVHATYYVTNITKSEMLLLECKLRPEGRDEAYDLKHTIEPMPGTKFKSSSVLVTVDGYIPVITRDGEALRGQMIFVDQFGNETLAPTTTFAQKRSLAQQGHTSTKRSV